MSKNARARRVRRRLIAGVAVSTVVSAATVATAVSAQATETPPGGPQAPVATPLPPPSTPDPTTQSPSPTPTTPTPTPTPTPTNPKASKAKPSPAPAPTPTTPSGTSSTSPTPVPTHPAAGAGKFDNALIATTALSYVGRWGGQACVDANRFRSGQCREFVDCVVSLASGGAIWPVDPAGNYQVGFSSVGAVPVAPADAVEGDIIQIGDHDDSSPLHTAIVLTNHGDGSYTVVDANWVGQPVTPELVGVHVWAPPPAAQFWRLGAVNPNTPAWHLPANSLSGAYSPLAGDVNQSLNITPPPAAPAVSTNTVNGLASGTITVRSADADPKHPATRMRYWIDGKSGEAIDNAAGGALLPLDTTKLPDGPHVITAQAVAADGSISALSAPTTINVTNHQLTIAVAAPSAPLLSGTVAVGVGAAPVSDLASETLTVDGVARAEPVAASGVLNLDTTALIAGQHEVSVAVTNREGRTVVWGPVTVTVTGAAVGPRAVVPSGGSNSSHSDLVTIDAAGRLLRYPWAADGTFGVPQPLGDGFGDVTALMAGHFTGPEGAVQLLAVRKDGSAHLYGIDGGGKLVDLGVVGGVGGTAVKWNTFTRLAAGAFSQGGQSAVVGIDGGGHAQLISVTSGSTDVKADAKANPSASAPVAKAQGLSVSPQLGGAVTIEAVPSANGTDQLMAVGAAGTVATYSFSAKHGFVPVNGAPAVTLPAPNPATTPVFGDFIGEGDSRQMLVTDPDGQTWIVSLADHNRPLQGADFQTQAPAAPPAPAAQAQLRLIRATG